MQNKLPSAAAPGKHCCVGLCEKGQHYFIRLKANGFVIFFTIYFIETSVEPVLSDTVLRAVVSNFQESGDGSENSNFFLFAQKDPFDEVFSKSNIQKFQRIFWQKSGKG